MNPEHLTTILFLAMFITSSLIAYTVLMGPRMALICFSCVIGLTGFVMFLAYIAQELAHVILS